ncbi:hypothetical protein BDL97_08G067100 [Sphagnum fallax]|nr:hypothetical protein BDL97_08G067100 [Sphagnum fallax]
MVRGGTRRDDGSRGLSGINIFAALESRRRKNEPENKQNLSEPFQFWAPSQVTVKSWANINDDDDDYRATTARLAEDHSPELPLPDPDSRLSQEEMPAAEKKAACQHSKRELKKKGLADLEAVLAEFGLSQNDENFMDLTLRRKVKKEKPFKDIHVPSMPKREAGTKEESAGDADAAAKAGASETATRAARLAATKKREKPHYNQQPLR